MKKALLSIAALILLGGIVHIGLGVAHMILVSGLVLDVLWFTSAGFALVYNAFINYLVSTAVPTQTRFFVLGHITNMLSSIMLGLILVKFPAPHVALLFLLLVAETVLVIWTHMQVKKGSLAHPTV